MRRTGIVTSHTACLHAMMMQILEVFGAGTAAIVSPVKAIYYNGEVGRRLRPAKTRAWPGRHSCGGESGGIFVVGRFAGGRSAAGPEQPLEPSGQADQAVCRHHPVDSGTVSSHRPDPPPRLC